MINVRMQHKDVQKLTPKITVIGVGGAGGNAVNNMIASSLQGVEFLVCNTDAQALEGSQCENKLQLGATVTGGLGAGAKPEIGRAAAEESLDDVLGYLDGANMAFITAGMGGGTGTGAAPVIARACRDKGILTVGVVTKPFHFEGTHRMSMAETGIEEMQDYVDTLIVIPNQNLFRIANEKTTFAEAFKMADSVLQSGVRGVTDLMVMPGLINLDFADIRSAMLEMGKAMMGTGEASEERRAIEAAEAAINNPLLDDVSMKGARGVIINVTGGYDMTLFEVDEACNRIRDEVDPNANIIFGSTFDESLEGVMRVSVVATGIDAAAAAKGKPVSTGGRSPVNTMTTQQQQERRIERKTPIADSVKASSAVSAEKMDSPAPAPAAYTPSSSVNIAPTVPAKASVGQSSLSLSISSATEEPQSTSVTETIDQKVPTAKIYKDSFIPPVPAKVEAQGTEFSKFTETSEFAALSAGKPEEAAPRPTVQRQDTVASPSLSLKPPVPGAQNVTKKRTPSLFERFTNPIKQQLQGHGEETSGETSGDSTGGVAPSVPATSAKDAVHPSRQGQLNIDASSGAEEGSDEFDIPAFLRRQAN